MKTFFGIAVGLALLFSNTMVQAMPPHKKTVPVFSVAVTIKNGNTTMPLNLQYQPSTLPGIPTPPTPSLTSVSTNSSSTVNIQMLPGNFYLISSYDSNHFCKFNFFVREDGLHKASRVFRQGSSVNCNISVSGKNSVTINMTKNMVTMTKNSPFAEGAYCLQQLTKAAGITYLYRLFSDNTLLYAYEYSTGSGQEIIPCRTLINMIEKKNEGLLHGSYTLTTSTNTIHMKVDTIGLVEATYNSGYNPSIGQDQIQTITTLDGEVYQRVQE